MMLPRVWGREMAANLEDPLGPELWDYLDCLAHSHQQGPLIRVVEKGRKREVVG